MDPKRATACAVAVLALVVCAGCSGFLGAGGDRRVETLTPAPVPSATATDAGPPAREERQAPTVDRYSRLGPTCERPPGLVIQIQVEALANNDPETNDGIRTVWRFAAPTNRKYTGPYTNFVELITTFYRPLLDARRTTYWPVNRTGDRATRTVAVRTNQTTETYRWELEKVSDGEYEDCWMTVGVAEADDRLVDVGEPTTDAESAGAPP